MKTTTQWQQQQQCHEEISKCDKNWSGTSNLIKIDILEEHIKDFCLKLILRFYNDFEIFEF